MKKSGFSLLELIVCVGILAVLSAFAMGQFSKAMNSARNATCLANMRALSLGYLNCNSGTWLNSGPYVFYNTEMASPEYQYSPGWLSWYCEDWQGYLSTGNAERRHYEMLGAYYKSADKEDQKKHLRALDKGGMWTAMKQSQSAYLCPLHQKAVEKQSGGRLRPMWSYVLNGWFYFTKDDEPIKGKATAVNDIKGRKGTPNNRPNDMVMNFAELQMEPLTLKRGGGVAIQPVISEEFSWMNDGILHYKGVGPNVPPETGTFDEEVGGGEVIGFNHTVGNKKVAHIAFLDGHVEQIRLPENATLENLQDLTEWLCMGLNYTLEGNLFRKDEYDE